MKIKIILDKDENPIQADNKLFKALSLQAGGENHEEKFDDPVMQELLEDLQRKFNLMLDDTMNDVHSELDKEYGDDYF